MKRVREKKTEWYFLFYCLCMVCCIICLFGLTACDNIPKDDAPVSGGENKKGEVPVRKYPGANDQMVYIPMEEPVLQQWSLDGEKQKEISLPLEEYGGKDDYSLIWVGNDELLWSVYSADDGDYILSTPLRQTGTKEEVLLEQTKELFRLKPEDDLSIGGLGDSSRETGTTYVDKNRILFFCDGELYEYNRITKKGPIQLESPEKEDGLGAVSSMMLNDKMVYHTGRLPGKVDEHAYGFWYYDLAAKERKSIDNRCCTSAAYVTDPARNKVYYQIMDDQGIWEYDSVTGEKKELVSEADFKKCYEKNHISWDDGSYEDLLFVENDRLYYIKDQENPMLFSYSFRDAALSFENGLTEVVRQFGYSDMDLEELTILKDKLLVYLRNENYELCCLCVDLKTAEIKPVEPDDPEIIFFGMLGTWYTDEDRCEWKKPAVRDKEKNAAITNKAETLDDQITLISQQSDMWLDKDYIGLYCAVTDLDHNGRLEVIVSTGIQGSGGHTISWYYQVSMDGLGLHRVREEGNASDIVDEIKTVFVDPETGTHYYCVSDYVSYGAGSRYIWYGAMALKDGLITKRTYAGGECTWNKKRTEEVWQYSRYRDGKEEKLKDKKADIDSLAEDFFNGFDKKKVNISWVYLGGAKKYSKQKLRKMLAKSYQEFQVSKSKSNIKK